MGSDGTRTRRLRTLPIRVRLVAGFSAAMFVVLAAAGAFVYWRVQYALDRGLDTELDQATQTIVSSVAPGPGDPRLTSTAPAEGTGVAWQILRTDGRVESHGGPAPAEPLVGTDQLARVGPAPVVSDLGSLLPAAAEPYRVHLTRLPAGNGYLVVAVRRDHRDEALRELVAQLSLAGLAALVVTGLVGGRLARAALDPVERYRLKAAEVARGTTGVRLDVPDGRDDEITRLGDTLNQMLSALEESLEQQERFVHEASHELRTPLTLLKSRIQLARLRPRDVHEHEQVLDDLAIDVARLIDLAEQLLAVGTATGSGGSSESSHCDVIAVVSATVDRHRSVTSRAEPPRLALHLDVDRGPCVVALSVVELERVMTNLLTNASIHGRPPVHVDVIAPDPFPGWVQIIVTDEGEGMTTGMLATATDRFTRAPVARSRPGAGLGLSLVRALVGQAGGELRLCHLDEHVSYGVAAPVPCSAHQTMTVTVLLPLG